MILRHRLMLRDPDIFFQENLDPLVREKLLHALASVASQACLVRLFILLVPLPLPTQIPKRKEKSSSRSLFVLVPVKGPVDGKESMFKSYYRVRAAFCVRFDYGKEIEVTR